MILTSEIQEMIVDAIAEDKAAPVVLPDHAYDTKGRVIVLVDGIPTRLHRHLHDLLIRPLGIHERMFDQSGVKGNVNPYLFTVVEGNQSPATHCRKGHPYAGNEMPPNSRGYRCRTCYRESRPAPTGTANKAKTHCPHGHPYDEKNTIIDYTGRRRCRICTARQKAESAARRARKDTTS